MCYCSHIVKIHVCNEEGGVWPQEISTIYQGCIITRCLLFLRENGQENKFNRL